MTNLDMFWNRVNTLLIEAHEPEALWGDINWRWRDQTASRAVFEIIEERKFQRDIEANYSITYAR